MNKDPRPLFIRPRPTKRVTKKQITCGCFQCNNRIWIKEIYNSELPSCANEFKMVCAALLLDVDLEFCGSV